MVIGTFRRTVGKTLTLKGTKLALRAVSKNTPRTQIALGAVALKRHTGELLQHTSQYLLGLPQTQEMKDQAFITLGDVAADLAVLARPLGVKLPSATKKIKLVGTRSAAILQLDSLATDILRQAEKGLLAPPQMTTTKKMVPMPQKGGVKEERTVEVIDTEAELVAEDQRQTEMKSFLTGAIDVFWRLCFDVFGTPPAPVLEAKLQRLQKEFPQIAAAEELSKAAKAKKAPKAPAKKASKAAEPVPA